LGEEGESIAEADLADLSHLEFSPLNILILTRKGVKPSSRILGIPDEMFKRRKEGLITKLEVRAVSLAKLGLTEESVVWDIGAGSGAISIEASFIARRGHIFAIEKNALDREVIQENIRRLGAWKVEIVPAFAPEGLDELPDPTSVFIGGSGGRLREILKAAYRRLLPGGSIVINAVTLESLKLAVEELRLEGSKAEVTLASFARSLSISDASRLQALNPVFIVRGEKNGK
jgi:precorrin-6Y C5,15-methyltransferase (decarboxylating)